MVIPSILVGLALLFAGRKIFWLVVGTIGFLVGMKLATIFFEYQSQGTLMLVAVGIGCLSAFLAIVLQKIAVGIAGFIAGAYGAFIFMEKVGLHLGTISWAPILIAGVVGVIIASIVFKWALILLSSLVGAYVLVTSFGLSSGIGTILFLVLLIAGIAVQAKSLKKAPPEQKKTPNK